MVICVNIKNTSETTKGKIPLFKNIKTIDVAFCILRCLDRAVSFVYFFLFDHLTLLNKILSALYYFNSKFSFNTEIQDICVHFSDFNGDLSEDSDLSTDRKSMWRHWVGEICGVSSKKEQGGDLVFDDRATKAFMKEDPKWSHVLSGIFLVGMVTTGFLYGMFH